MKAIIHMLVVLSMIGVVSGGGLSLLNNWAAPRIAANRKADTERAIFLVQPAAKDYEVMSELPFEAYKVLDGGGQTLGYALPWEGNGFQGKMGIMIGLQEDLATITFIEVLDQVETPGLGTKITEKPFTSQFESMKASPDVLWIKGAPPTKANEIQTITGATISAVAIVDIINDGLSTLRASLGGGVQ